MNDPQMNAVQEFFACCGTWDELEANNGATLEGDFGPSPTIEDWRKAHRRMSFSNQRGWLTTVLFGPKFVAETTGWNGQHSMVDVAFDQVIEIVGAGSKNTGFSIDHLKSLTFGYSSFPDWENTVLIEVEEETDPPQPKTEDSNQPPYRRGDIVRRSNRVRHSRTTRHFSRSTKTTAVFTASRTWKRWNGPCGMACTAWAKPWTSGS